MSNTHVLKAFLAGVNPSTPLSQLRAFLYRNFEGITQVKSSHQKRQGYVFVHFKNKQFLEAFVKIKSFIFHGRTLTVKPYLTGNQLVEFKSELQQRRIFVKHLPFNWNDSDLERFFSQYGKIDSAYVVYNKKTRFSRQFGYVVTATKELADYIDYQKHFEVNGRFIFAQKHHSSHKKIFGPSHRNHESSYNDSGKS